MIYTLTIERSDGLVESRKLTDKLLEDSSIHLMSKVAGEMYNAMKNEPEITGNFIPLKRSTLQPGEQLLPSNPSESHMSKVIRDMLNKRAEYWGVPEPKFEVVREENPQGTIYKAVEKKGSSEDEG